MLLKGSCRLSRPQMGVLFTSDCIHVILLGGGGGAYFGWKAFWGSNPEWHSHRRIYATGGRHFGNAGRAPTVHYILAFTLRVTKISRSQVSHKCHLGKIRKQTWRLFHELPNWPANLHHPQLALQVARVNLRSAKYLHSCRSKGFLASSNFESKLLVGALMWSAKSGTLRSSRNCLLPMYHGAAEEMIS
jgi:hypothetical protein